VSQLLWQGRPLSVAVRRLKASVALGEVASLLKTTPPQIDTVVFRWEGQIYLAFGGGLPELPVGDAVAWQGKDGTVLVTANAADSLTELTQRAIDSPSGGFGKGLAKVAHLLHIDRALDRLGAPEWLLVMSDWGPYETVTEPLPDAAIDWPVSPPVG
jgi:hypothetical protein